MAARKKKLQFMVLDDDNNACCGEVYSSYERAMTEAKGHLEDQASCRVSGDTIEGWRIVQVVSELSAEVSGVTITEKKV